MKPPGTELEAAGIVVLRDGARRILFGDMKVERISRVD